MKIALIGAGNVAFHLCQQLKQIGIPPIQIWNRTESNAKVLSECFGIPYSTKIEELTKEAEIYILAVTDNAIAELISKLYFPERAIVAHTSGATSLSALSNSYTKHCGVFYPLASFSSNSNVDFKAMPVFIEGTDQPTIDCLTNLAHKLHSSPTLLASNDRLNLHLAATIACNFTNLLYSEAYKLCQKQRLDFQLLHPLLKGTLDKALKSDNPTNVQTGPALRNDVSTMQQHLQALASDPALAQIYNLLSQRIQSNAQA